MAKAKILSKIIDTKAQTVTFKFADDSEQVLNLSDCTDEMRLHYTLHGVSQKIGDSAAGAGSQSDPLAYAKEQIAALIASTTGDEGKWTTRTPGAAKQNLTIEALARIRGTDVDTMREFFNALSDEQKKGVKANKQVKAMVSTIRAERDEKAAADSDETLEGIFGE